MERADRKRRACFALGVLLACCPCAFALNPSLDINQYAHNAWTVRDGFFKGVIYSIAQTPDGYLWLGTEFGLLRFDGDSAPSPGSRPRVQTSPTALFEAFSLRVTGVFGSAPRKGWQAGRTAS